MGDEVVNMWAEGEVRVEGDPQDTGVSFEWEGGVLRMTCGVALDYLLSDVNRVTVDLGAERASPCSLAHC